MSSRVAVVSPSVAGSFRSQRMKLYHSRCCSGSSNTSVYWTIVLLPFATTDGAPCMTACVVFVSGGACRSPSVFRSAFAVCVTGDVTGDISCMTGARYPCVCSVV